MKDDLNNILEDLIAKSLVGETSIEEEKHLHDWIAESPDNEVTFNTFKKTFELTSDHYKSGYTSQKIPIEIDQEWAKFVHTIENRGPKVVAMESSKSTHWLSVAAIISLVIVSGLVINYLLTQNPVIEYQTAELIQEISLPDGSIVTLNKNSNLSYNKDFGKEDRTVKLNGEAFFAVKPNRKKGFLIRTKKTNIQVLGTSFNVEANDDSQRTKVVVATGVVAFSSNETDQVVTLKAGDVGILADTSHGKIVSRANDDINFLSWKTHKLIFEEDDLNTVIETINKVYESNILINTSTIVDCQVTVTFDQQSLDAILSVLESTLNLTIETVDDKIEITSAGC